MVTMENAEEVMQILDRFTRLKQKEIPKELDEYLGYVAKTGDTVFKWSSLKYLFREKLLNVIKHFHDNSPRIDEIPNYPNVDPFNYESMKSSLLERLELFNAAPFTIQRLCELLIDPRKQYSRIDKFMRALEKNILVVSTVEPGRKRTESENGDSLDSVVNGDLSLDVNVDIDMEAESLFNMESAQNAQNSNGDTNKTDVEEKKETEDKSNDNSKTVPIVMASLNVPHIHDDDILPNPKKVKLSLPDEEVELEKLLQKKDLEKQKILTGSSEEMKKSIDNTEPNKGENMTLTKADAEIAKKKEITVEQKEQDEIKDRNTEQQQDPIKCQEDTEIAQEKTIKILDKKESNKVDIVEQTVKEENKKLSTITEVEETKDIISGSDEKNSKPTLNDEEKKEEGVIEKQELEKGEKEVTKEVPESEPSEQKKQQESAKRGAVAQEEGDKHEFCKEMMGLTKEDEKKEQKNEAVTLETKKDKLEKDTKKTDEKETCKPSLSLEEKKEAKPVTELNVKTKEISLDPKSLEETKVETKEKEIVIETIEQLAEDNIAEEQADTMKQSITATIKEQEIATASVTTTETTALVLPSLTLNDHPMIEDLAIEEVPPTVEEIVMAEPPSLTNEMAIEDVLQTTVAIVGVSMKSTPTEDGMEVDDTSQEAMDQ
uniref:Serine/threonine-protein phosphatase 4 regulatory subunit 2 n=1 Tax=Glossina brevipalpis TaxID=37001 RepID=A0A1A9X575_9MUSC